MIHAEAIPPRLAAPIPFSGRRGGRSPKLRLGRSVVAALLLCPLIAGLPVRALAQDDEAVYGQEGAVGLAATPDAESSTFLGQGTSVALGLGPALVPAYEGARKLKLRPFPYLDVKGLLGGRVFLSTARGLGANLLELGPFRAGLAVNYGGGRKSSDSSRLRGLSDLNGGAVLSGFMTYTLKPFAFELKADNTFGPNPGTVASFGMDYGFMPLPKLHLSIGPHVTWADSRYDRTHFGVSTEEAARATAEGNPMTAYTPGSGIKDVGLSVTGIYQVNRHWGAIAHLGLSDLVGSPARNSPLTQRRFQPSVAIGALYRF